MNSRRDKCVQSQIHQTPSWKKIGSFLPDTNYLTHPPGLYQSWNFGIQNVRAKYVYISTVGDSITRPGLEHLLEVAEEFQSDVVVSKPHFINAAGEPAPDSPWLIDLIVDRLKIRQPRLLTLTEQFLFTVTNLWCALLGSSASNLYRADCLKKRPFPVEFGTAGDGAWGVENIFDIKIAVTPERFSNFRQHEKAYSLSDYHVESLASKLFLLAQTVVARERRINPAIESLLTEVCWPELERSLGNGRAWRTPGWKRIAGTAGRRGSSSRPPGKPARFATGTKQPSPGSWAGF